VGARQTSLADIEIGGRAVIHAVRCARPDAVRLMEMGMLPGTEVEIVRRAPLGDPLELRLRGYALSIRSTEARLIEVEPVTP